MEITKHDFLKVVDERTAASIMEMLTRSTVSAEIKQGNKMHMRKGKLVDTVVSLKHYDMDEVIAYCSSHIELTNADVCISACNLLRNYYEI